MLRKHYSAKRFAFFVMIGIVGLASASAQDYCSTHLLFHGSTDRVTVANNSSLIVNDRLTIEAWVKYTGGGGVNPRIIEIIDTFNLHIDIATGTVGFWLFSEEYPSDNGWTRVYSQDSFPLDTWTHLAGVWDGVEMRLYVDGQLVGSTEFLGSLFHGGPGDQSLKIGNGWTHIDGINGAIDEVRFSSVERYQSDFDPFEFHSPDSGTVGLWHFDEGSGDVTSDSGPHGNDGQIDGAEWIVEDVASASGTWGSIKALF